MSDTKKTFPIDPKDLTPAGIGFFLGILILVGFVVLAKTLGMPLLIDHAAIPHQ